MSALRGRIGRRRLLAGVGVVIVLAAVGMAAADPFAGHAASGDSSLDNGSPTSTRRVVRTSLASQTQVSGTLGYAGTWTISVPPGIDASALAQAGQTVSSARAGLTGARATVAADAQLLSQARAALQAAKGQRRAACVDAPSSGGACATAEHAVTSDAAAVTSAHQKSVSDEAQLASAAVAFSAAQRALTTAESSATSYGSASSFTKLPSPGRIVRRGQALFAIDGEPTLLLYGSTPAWRAFRAGMSPGADVAELNANLRALGYGVSSRNAFTAAASMAISALQRAHGLAVSGTLKLGSVVFEPGALRVKTVAPAPGETVQPGPLLTATSTRHDISVALDAAQQSEVKVGDRVSVTLPDNRTTAAVVSSVGKVATTPSGDEQAAGGPSSPTIDVDVRLIDPNAAGALDQAPVEVSITEQSVRNVLAVPVEALVALAGGAYAVEEVEANGAHRLTAVTPGLFDDAQGLVEVSGNALAVGQRVVVPAS